MADMTSPVVAVNAKLQIRPTPRNYTLDTWAILSAEALWTEIQAVRDSITDRGIPYSLEMGDVAPPTLARLVHIQFNGKHGRVFTADGQPLDYLYGWEIGHFASEGPPHARLIWVQPWTMGIWSDPQGILHWAERVMIDWQKLGLLSELS